MTAPSSQPRRRPPLTSTASPASLLCLLLLLVHHPQPCNSRALDEKERLAEYKRRGYTWPIKHMVPDTEGWRHLMDRRFDQVANIEDGTERYNGWVQTISMALVAPNFTENGWGLTRAPPDLTEELVKTLRDGLPTAKEEYQIEVIPGPLRPLFVSKPELNRKVLEELRPLHEEWSGVPLVGATAYGLRAYRNQSSLMMHVDKSLTHIISCIYHIDHSEDSEPWPIIIEDFQGNTNEVVLESGDMLFYESSKCIHGRPHAFNGSWYSSIFVHYYPQNWDTRNRDLENHYAVPPHWNQRKHFDVDKAVVVGTGFFEPDCKDNWCGLENTVKWRGPAKEGIVITAGYDPEDPTTWRTDGAYKKEEEKAEGRDEL